VTKISKSTPSPHRDDQNTENEATREYINPTVQNFEFEVTHRIKCEEYVRNINSALGSFYLFFHKKSYKKNSSKAYTVYILQNIHNT